VVPFPALFVGLGPGSWVALLALGIARRRWRLVVLEAALAVGLLCEAGYLVAPNYPLSLWGIARNDSLAWIFLMLPVTVIALWIAGHVHRARLPTTRCPACDYELIGNVSGVCPECGSPVPSEIRRIVSPES
jgi:hypothetical protein